MCYEGFTVVAREQEGDGDGNLVADERGGLDVLHFGQFLEEGLAALDAPRVDDNSTDVPFLDHLFLPRHALGDIVVNIL